MEVKFKTKEVVVKNFLSKVAATVFVTPCPHGKKRFMQNDIVRVGSLGCLNCANCGGIDWDKNICNCKKEKKAVKSKPGKTVKRKMPRGG